MLSRSVSSYTTRSSSTLTAVEGRDRRPSRPRASYPPVPSEIPSPASVDEHVAHLLASGEQLMQVLELWNVNKKAVWQVSATFARFSNECNASLSVFAAAGADVTVLQSLPSEIRPVLEQVLSHDPSPSRFQQDKASLDPLNQRFLSELNRVKESYGVASETPKQSEATKSRSINRCLETFVKSVGKLKEAVDVWSMKEIPDDDIRASLQQLEEAWKALDCSFDDRGMDLADDVTPIYQELKTLINTLISPDVATEWDEPFDDQLSQVLIRLLSTLKTKQAQLVQARQELKRRATFRLRSSAFEELPAPAVKVPSTMSRATGLRRNFTR
ncbi:hypothetical protein DACRYDRAFT_114941 [Dacryopinax primogenitus]|uniref:Aip3p/Bud6 N-terminal domain-containing protein n=1 Tax=Dacryopinax primogenitus (strain DJM 731) TaxID=1858805 RepID=M5GBW3_DACPD|nr:uncharacterized protein DACRYDRAFT_114941 [Dacryopinax primogenitus]EJU03562.1 hypothetical protein DACRYDRAFT_114941 [Dacryopinax primogenitus]